MTKSQKVDYIMSSELWGFTYTKDEMMKKSNWNIEELYQSAVKFENRKN